MSPWFVAGSQGRWREDDPDSPMRVTVSAPEPMTKEQAVALADAILKVTRATR